MSFNKENINDVSKKQKKSPRKTFGTPKKNILNSSESINESSELTSEFAGYLDYVRQLENENINIKLEKENIISLCNSEIINIKSTYGGEIDALRKALDEITAIKCSTDYHNEKLLEENNNLKIKFARKIDLINDLEKKYEEAEALLIKNRKSIDKYDQLCLENEDLMRYNVLLNDQLKCEINKRSEAENRVLTLCDEVDFMNKIKSTNNAIQIDNSLNMSLNKNELFYNEKFDNDIIEMRNELTEEFDEYKKQMENIFKSKLDELNNINNKLNEKYNKMYNEKKNLQINNDKLCDDKVSMESQINVLNAHNLRNNELISKINNEHDLFIKEILEENENLKNKLEIINMEVRDLMNDKIVKERETYIFRSMLKGEQSRVNLSDISSPKKRKIDNDDEFKEITAWSKESIKIFYNVNGNYLQLINDGLEEIDLNEWKIEIVTSSEASDLLFTFPTRVVKSESFIKIWSQLENVEEDEYNIIMNIDLPSCDIMTCELSNDMGEVEASFKINKSPSRKILKANTKIPATQDKCSIM